MVAPSCRHKLVPPKSCVIFEFNLCKLDFLLLRIVVTPEPGPTRMASPNRNPGTLGLILFIYILLCFLFQKCRDPNSRLYPKGESEPELGLLQRFQLSYQNIFLMLFLLRFSICVEVFSNGRPTNIYISSNEITVNSK